MFQTSVSLWEVAARVGLVYLGLLLLTRISGKREVGELSPMEFLSMLILSETVSPALTKADTSLTASLFAATCLIGISMLVGRLTYRSKKLQRLVEGTPTAVIRNGRIQRAAMHREGISEDELLAELRKSGVDGPGRVKLAMVETDGRISVVLRDGKSTR